MGPWTFCSLLSPRLRCSVLDEKEDTSLSSAKNIQISLLTAQQRQVQDSGLQRQRFFSSPVTGTNDPCCSWRGEALTGCLCAQKRNAHTTQPSICAAAELSPNEIYTIYPKRQRSYLLGTWDTRSDFEQEPAAAIALKYWDAITEPAFYPYKINHYEGKKRNTAPGGILFPGCMAVLGPEHWLDILKVVAVVVLRFQHEGDHPGKVEIFTHPGPPGVLLHHGLTIFSPLPASVPSLWNLPSEWKNAHGLPISNFRLDRQLDNWCLHGVLLKGDNIFTYSTSCGPVNSVCC